MTVRVRIAPSPTGEPHVGTAYVALFNWLFAKKYNGKFLLRIEDTDQKRSAKEHERAIIDALQWTGIFWDEGPDVGGPYGPYRQSERRDIYVQHAMRLLEEGKAYKCFATSEELAMMRAVSTKGRKGYDRRYRYLSESEILEKEKAGIPFVIRLKVPLEGEGHFVDEIRGPMTFFWAEVDDQIILKSDGMPTYHLANVVDDHLMKITHVLRGDEWLSSTPKHLLLYDAFGWTPPTFCHLPLLLDASGKKLSKRRSPTSILFFRDIGILPEGLINFLSLMGYSRSDEKEIYTKEELSDLFDISRMGKSGAFFDIRRLKWVNQQHIKDIYSDEKLVETLISWRLNRSFLEKIIPLAKSRIKTLAEFFSLSDFLFIDEVPISIPLLTPKETSQKKVAAILTTLIWILDDQKDWSAEGIKLASKEIASLWNISHKKNVMPILFASIMGKQHGLPMFESFSLIGMHQARIRLMRAASFLHVFTQAELVQLKTLYEQGNLIEYDC